MTNLNKSRNFITEVDKLAKRYDVNYFIVTDGASGYSNDGTNEAVKNARENHKKWEINNGFNPDEEWR